MLIAAGALAGLSVATGIGPAQAAGQICEQGGVGLCLNDWNGGGSGNAVKMGQNGWSHQNFGAVFLSQACGAGRVTHTCPFAVGSGMNDAMFDDIIVAIQYNPIPSLCVGSGQNTRGAVLVACPTTQTGTGGGWGVLQVERQNVNNCFSQNGDTQLTNVHWSSNDQTVANLTGSTATGNQAAMFNHIEFNIACWGTG